MLGALTLQWVVVVAVAGAAEAAGEEVDAEADVARVITPPPSTDYQSNHALFEDDDCELAADAADASLDWRRLRAALSKLHSVTALDGQSNTQVLEEPLLVAAQRLQPRRAEEPTVKECPLGVATACLISATKVGDARPCIRGLSLQRMLASRWPIFMLLGRLQRLAGSSRDSASCDDLPHPSLDWADWRAKLAAFGESVPPWLTGQSGSDLIPDEFNDAVGEAQGIVWKASSMAVSGGTTISEWTGQCSFGVIGAYAIRAAALVLADGDAYRIVQRAIEALEVLLHNIEEALQSPWRIFDVLHALSLMKKTFHDVQLVPGDLLPLEPLETAGEQEVLRTPLWRTATAGLRRAASTAVADVEDVNAAGSTSGQVAGVVLLTGLPHYRLNFAMNLFKHVDRLGFLPHVAVVPFRENITDSCKLVAHFFAEKRPGRVPDTWSPCLPFVSQFPQRAQYLYLYMALQLGLTVMWFDLHVVWVQSPLPWLRSIVGGDGNGLATSMTTLTYQNPCHSASAATLRGPVAEVFLADEFYAPTRSRSSLLLLRPTNTVRYWLGILLRWVCTYPFASAIRGLQYLAHPDLPDSVPSVSMLPASQDVPRVAVGKLDVEQKLVGFDGWFGDVESIVAYDVGEFLAEDDRVALLDKLLFGSEQVIQQVLSYSRKHISPLRPRQRLYDAAGISGGDAREACTWEQVPGAFIGRYAAGVEDAFANPTDAQRVCARLGVDCFGITCSGVTTPGEGQTCTLRAGDPPLAASPSGEVSYLKRCPTGTCDAPPIKRIVHVNFADGCCEVEQQQSSETAQQFGADESRLLRGRFLDPSFKARNHLLLRFNRTPEMTQHKTPSGKVGYYVWKPYVILRTLQDPELPWDTTVIAWTDAGIHFVSDMRPLIFRYLRESDVSAARTPMMEGEFSKRDAFVLLDADYQSIMETNQVATGVILVRKTRLALLFLERWLKACEDRRIMTEEPSVLGIPEYHSFRNNNDDQTAFSLLFKRFGFLPFSVAERDAVVYTGRNLAKFVKASDDFALGRKTDRDAYLRAADDAAAARMKG